MTPLKLHLHNHMLVLLPLLFVSHFFNVSHSQSSPDLCHPYDRTILLRIKSHFGNPSSLASWDPTTDCCSSWNDINCNLEGHVTLLMISQANDIRGPIPPFLDELPWLTQLLFSNIPNLSGSIPSYIGKLTNLTVLKISGTNVAGPIPNILGELVNLNQLSLSSNKFTGMVPDFIGKLKNLIDLDLSDNRLTGPIPKALAQATGLELLLLNSNKLSGPIPEFLALRLTNLKTMNLGNNYFSGPIPTSLGLHPNITILTLSKNKLSGSIPKSLGRATIGILSLDHNKLTGDASFLFEKTNTNLFNIHINNNLLKFDFSDVDLARKLLGFNISHNMIYGSLPKRFGQLQVQYIDVSYNQLCGPIPNGRRFKQADPIIFAHNKCLCGGPLPACK